MAELNRRFEEVCVYLAGRDRAERHRISRSAEIVPGQVYFEYNDIGALVRIRVAFPNMIDIKVEGEEDEDLV